MEFPNLSPEQQRYLAARRLQIRWWMRLGWILLAVPLGGLAWLYRHHPLYLNPFLLLDKLRVGQVSDIEVARLAAFGNLAFLACAGLFAGLIVLTYVALWTEGRTIRILTTPSPVRENLPPSAETPQGDPHDPQA